MLNATHFTVVYEFVVSLTIEKVEQEISRNNSNYIFRELVNL
ncbi:hypothetical protein VCHA38O206_60145 [Vibrio chagasii]|nr:hypothetical protein VCHA28FP16_10744 [Vibrio chagasii]CAH6899093.1 hypothetical protein VCHA35P150_20363 [Vibrio chagasii]CAH7379393.1 hypothetical protein VCHA38O206_60145 [Vibrio chagasii]